MSAHRFLKSAAAAIVLATALSACVAAAPRGRL
jgi:hypothetical protein